MIIKLNRPEFRRTAFTLNELVVVVAIVATIPGILLPALQRSKTETIAQLTIRDSALLLATAVDLHRASEGQYPESFQDLSSSSREILEDQGYEIDPTTGIVRDPELDYCYQIVIDSNSYVIKAFPCGEKRDGSSIYEIDRTGQVIFVGTDADAANQQASRQEESDDLALESIALMFSLSGEQGVTVAEQIRSNLRDPITQSFLIDAIDQDDNGRISTDEIRQFYQPKPTDSPLTLAAKDTIAQAFVTRGLDRGPTVEISPEDWAAIDPARLLTAESIAPFVARRVDQPAVGRSLAEKVYRSEFLELTGEADACQGVIEAFKREIQAQTDKTIDPVDAQLISSLIEVMCTHQGE